MVRGDRSRSFRLSRHQRHALGASFLANVIPVGTFGTLFSAGTVPLLNGVVGVEVASGVIVLLAKFFEQAITVRPAPGGRTNSAPESDR